LDSLPVMLFVSIATLIVGIPLYVFLVRFRYLLL
jgi:hypothetical protein